MSTCKTSLRQNREEEGGMGNPEKSPPLKRKRPRPLLATYHASFSFFLVFVASGAPEIKLHSYVKFQAIKRCVMDTEKLVPK